LARHIESLRSANAEVRARRCDEAFGVRNDLGFWQRGRTCVSVFRQAFALLHVEQGEAFEERHAPRLVAVLLGPLALGLGNEGIGVARGDAALALHDVAAHFLGLGVGQPCLRREARTHDVMPQNQDVDARIGAARERVLGQAKPRLRARRTPRLHPRRAARLKLGDDAGGHLVIERRLGRTARLLAILSPALSACRCVRGFWRHRCRSLWSSARAFPRKGGGR
jgi:hypothetical protein